MSFKPTKYLPYDFANRRHIGPSPSEITEMLDLVGDGVMSEGAVATQLGLNGIPPEAEVMLIERDLRLVEMTGGRYHVSKVTTAAAVDAIMRAKSAGLPVTCDTAPHYFTLNEEAVRDYRTFAKVSPPLRSEENRQAIVEGIASGVIDAIVSDHSPRDQDSKRLPFNQASFGVVGLETLLPVTLEKVNENSFTLLEALAPLTWNPAKSLGVKEGSIEKGFPANFVIFDLNRPYEINGYKFVSKCKNSPFNGKKVSGSVLKTIRDGNIVFDSNAL